MNCTQINDKLAQRLQELAENEIASKSLICSYSQLWFIALSGAEQGIANNIINQVLASPRLSRKKC
ncbi:hypothetical protein O9992_04630 [Vibrio lentus]|nr:hypothetical protein [Vibrio lentus]